MVLTQALLLQFTIFSFDDHAIPFKKNLKLTLVQAEKHAANPVVPRGPAGSADAYRAQFYGSVLRIDGKFRLWYMAGADKGEVNKVDTGFRPAYAESEDGIHWRKPSLGLTEFKGSRNNNLVEIMPPINMARLGSLASFVLYEPEDRDPTRRYKMLLYARYYQSTKREEIERAENTPSTVIPLFSADGLRWRLAIPPPRGEWFVENEVPFPVKNNFELGGLYKFDDAYYAAGQEMWPDVSMPDGGRVRRTMVTHWSGDFVHWSHDRSFSFQRYGYRSPEVSMEEAHEPAGVWNRGNVLVATYGLWHGSRDVAVRRMDLGLLVSNNGVHFREPIADFVFLPKGNDGEWDQRGLIHGQGYVNAGDRTYIYYGSWDPSGSNDGAGAIGLATIARDRFGYLSTRDNEGGQFTTSPITRPARPSSLFVNADGLGRESRLELELIDKTGAAIPGFTAVITESGLHVPVRWSRGTRLDFSISAFRFRVRITGARAGEAKFHAAYVQ